MKTVHWALLVEAAFVIGTMLALYRRVWRYALPRGATRGIILAGATTVVGYAWGIYDRLEKPFSYRDAVAGFALTTYIASLVALYVWTRMPEGRKERHAAIARWSAWRMLRAHEAQEAAEEASV